MTPGTNSRLQSARGSACAAPLPAAGVLSRDYARNVGTGSERMCVESGDLSSGSMAVRGPSQWIARGECSSRQSACLRGSGWMRSRREVLLNGMPGCLHCSHSDLNDRADAHSCQTRYWPALWPTGRRCTKSGTRFATWACAREQGEGLRALRVPVNRARLTFPHRLLTTAQRHSVIAATHSKTASQTVHKRRPGKSNLVVLALGLGCMRMSFGNRPIGTGQEMIALILAAV